MNDIFVSYARSTEARAQQVADAFQALGFDVWRDDALPVHRAFAEVIEERLRAAKAVVVLWSADAAKSQWVRAEADLARSIGTLVQLRLDSVPLPLPFNQIECADLSAWRGEDTAAWRKVVDSVRALVGGEVGSKPATGAAQSAGADQPLLAVLPFDDMSPGADLAFFSDGVSEEILDTVTRVSGLRVIARSSSFQFRGADKAMDRVVPALKATHVLDGSVRRAGDKVRIAARLVDGRTGVALWAERFDGDLTDVFDLQDRIACAVATVLEQTLNPVPRRTVDPEAYDLYLRMQERGIEADRRLAGAERVTVLSPAFPQGWVLLSNALNLAARDHARSPDEREVLFDRAEAAARRALELDPGLGLAHVALANTEPLGAYRQIEAHLSAALALSPETAEVQREMGQFLRRLGRVDEAQTFLRRAVALDPLDQPSMEASVASEDFRGRTEVALAMIAADKERWSQNWLWLRTWAIETIHAKAWDSFAEVERIARERGHMQAQPLRLVLAWGRAVRDGDESFADATLARTEAELAATGRPSLNNLNALWTLGRHEEVFGLIARLDYGRLLDRRRDYVAQFYTTAIALNAGAVRGMMEDPRVMPLYASLGLCDYWVATDRWPDCAEWVPYDFRAEARRFAEPLG